eukprot:3023365-Pyramimonas_sp.AAC.1
MPHLLFEQFLKERPSEFAKSILGGSYDCGEFWDSATGRKLAAEHPVLRDRPRRLLKKTVPLGLHGDGGEYSNTDS